MHIYVYYIYNCCNNIVLSVLINALLFFYTTLVLLFKINFFVIVFQGTHIELSIGIILGISTMAGI